jgi:phage terminase small subunit
MGARGRTPEPRRLQVIKGRPGGTRQNGKPLTNPPVVVPASPPKPDDLGSDGSRLWDLVTPELVWLTILGRIDLMVPEAYCRVYDEWKREDPQARRWLWLIDRMTTLAIQLGLTPAARLRMKLAGTVRGRRACNLRSPGPVSRADVPLSEGLERLSGDLLDGDAFTRSELAARGLPKAPKPVTVTGFGLRGSAVWW